jgi:hypothetical protein
VRQPVIVVGPPSFERRPLALHLSFPGAHAASKHLFCLPNGALLSPSSEKNMFPLSHNRVPSQGKRVILEAKSVFFERMYQVANTGFAEAHRIIHH